MWTRLFLSRKLTSPPDPFWAQPSGYEIEYAAALSWNVRKTWLSGMSPVAALFASADSAPAPAPPPPDEEPPVDELLPDELPQAASASTDRPSASVANGNRSRFMARDGVRKD